MKPDLISPLVLRWQRSASDGDFERLWQATRDCRQAALNAIYLKFPAEAEWLATKWFYLAVQSFKPKSRFTTFYWLVVNARLANYNYSYRKKAEKISSLDMLTGEDSSPHLLVDDPTEATPDEAAEQADEVQDLERRLLDLPKHFKPAPFKVARQWQHQRRRMVKAILKCSRRGHTGQREIAASLGVPRKQIENFVDSLRAVARHQAMASS